MTILLQISRGFHLIEIMIALGIIGLLSAMSIPVYSKYLIHERRVEAAAMLSSLATALEEFHFENNSYQSATLKNLKFPEIFAGNNYQLVIAFTTMNDFLITAKPINRQAEADFYCGSLNLNSFGEKSVSGSGMVDECW